MVSQLTVGPCDEADVASASDRYALRFAGEVGRFLLEVQTRIVLELLEPWRGASVLDVGGGHAQLAAPLTEAGFDVTVLCSNPVACSRPRRLLGDRARVLVGDLLDPPVRPGSFDVALSFRMLPHARDWRRLIAGLCAAARHAVVVDFPVRSGFNALSPLLFPLKRCIESDTRPFRSFRIDELRDAFNGLAFTRHDVRRELFLPLALHRLGRAPRLSRSAESLCRAIGLTAIGGSPAILRAQPARRQT